MCLHDFYPIKQQHQNLSLLPLKQQQVQPHDHVPTPDSGGGSGEAEEGDEVDWWLQGEDTAVNIEKYGEKKGGSSRRGEDMGA